MPARIARGWYTSQYHWSPNYLQAEGSSLPVRTESVIKLTQVIKLWLRIKKGKLKIRIKIMLCENQQGKFRKKPKCWDVCQYKCKSVMGRRKVRRPTCDGAASPI